MNAPKRFDVVNRYDGTWRVYDIDRGRALPVRHQSEQAARAAADRYNQRAAKAVQ